MKKLLVVVALVAFGAEASLFLPPSASVALGLATRVAAGRGRAGTSRQVGGAKPPRYQVPKWRYVQRQLGKPLLAR